MTSRFPAPESIGIRHTGTVSCYAAYDGFRTACWKALRVANLLDLFEIEVR